MRVNQATYSFMGSHHAPLDATVCGCSELAEIWGSIDVAGHKKSHLHGDVVAVDVETVLQHHFQSSRFLTYSFEAFLACCGLRFEDP